MEAVGQLAGGLAHDFINVLAIIVGYTELLLESPDIKDPLARDNLREILLAAERSEALTRQLLTLGRRSALRPRPVDPAKLLPELLVVIRRLIEEDIAVSTDIDCGGAMVFADPNSLHQVLMNLAINSRDAMTRGGRITLRARSEEVAARDARPLGLEPGPYVRIDFTDTGSGMEAETQRRIFEPFFTTKPPGKGTGLGLSVVHGIVKQSGGSVQARSAPGAGTTITILLPQHEARPVEPAPPEPPPERGGSETILVVEDDPGVRLLLRDALANFGYRVIDAEDGHAALKILDARRDSIDLVATDVVMPTMSGLELADRIRERFGEMPILFISGHTERVLRQRGVHEEHCLRKPFVLEELRKAAREAIDARSPPYQT